MPRDKNSKETITAKGTEITVVSGGDDNDYISLTDIAKYKSDDPNDVIKNWLRSKDPMEQIEEIQKPYKERILIADKVSFSCTMISKQFSQMLSIDFEVSKIDDIDYVRNQILSPQPIGNGSNINWLQPLWESFIKIYTTLRTASGRGFDSPHRLQG